MYRTEYVPYEKEVREIKAPTDESIRLLMEMVKKAEDSVVAKLHLTDNTFNIAVVAFKHPYPYDNTTVKYKFKFNGMNYEGEVIVNRMSSLQQNIVHEVAKVFAAKITNEFASELLKILRHD